MRKHYDFSNAKQGAVVPRSPKATELRIWLDQGVYKRMVETIENQGGGTIDQFIEDAISAFLGNASGASVDEATLRRILREELQSRSG
jgi:hypothetical protein